MRVVMSYNAFMSYVFMRISGPPNFSHVHMLATSRRMHGIFGERKRAYKWGWSLLRGGRRTDDVR